ncbi:MAG: hypothetical protein EZS28_032753 [Streblomastix strix]|uniref:C2H2-type domain-containing protein n=1 Tax=Streblomastix strix TaxID=222440 RepID=A0A5J4UP08_9EUKA|nr:MAG: hypothetical protein EZS28_032753 [Streblomastix strix]
MSVIPHVSIPLELQDVLLLHDRKYTSTGNKSHSNETNDHRDIKCNFKDCGEYVKGDWQYKLHTLLHYGLFLTNCPFGGCQRLFETDAENHAHGQYWHGQLYKHIMKWCFEEDVEIDERLEYDEQTETYPKAPGQGSSADFASLKD